jgi:hypothetical protein
MRLSFTSQPQLTPGKDTVPIEQEAGWASEPVGTGAENLAPTRFLYFFRTLSILKTNLSVLLYLAHIVVVFLFRLLWGGSCVCVRSLLVLFIVQESIWWGDGGRGEVGCGPFSRALVMLLCVIKGLSGFL